MGVWGESVHSSTFYNDVAMSIYTGVCLSIQDALLYIPILYSLSQSYPLLSISSVLPLLPQLRTRLDSKIIWTRYIIMTG